jgi:transcriptional regulator with XRE-family HTH domain
MINAPLKKVCGEWALDFSMADFQKAVLNRIARKSSPIRGAELRFIIDYFEMSYREFAKICGVSHPAIVKWEKETAKMSPSTETYIRLYILDHLNISDKEFRKLYLAINPEKLSTREKESDMLEIDINKIAC